MTGENVNIREIKAEKTEEGYWWHVLFLRSLERLEEKLLKSEKAKKVIEHQIRRLEEEYIDKIVACLERLIIKYGMYELSDRVIKSQEFENDNELLIIIAEHVYDNYYIEKHIHIYKSSIRDALKRYIEIWCNTDYKVTIDYSFNLKESEEKLVLEVYLDIIKRNKEVASFKIAEVRIY